MGFCAGCCGSHEQDAPERIDDTGWCRCLDADLDELEKSLRIIEAVLPLGGHQQ